MKLRSSHYWLSAMIWCALGVVVGFDTLSDTARIVLFVAALAFGGLSGTARERERERDAAPRREGAK
jgi:hypothetical protein